MSEAPVLLVASSGGHLTQLIELAPRLSLPGPRRWVTFAGPQSEAALRGADVDHVGYIPPRGLRAVVGALPTAWRLLRRHRPKAVVSTGAAVAVAFLPLARLMRIPAYYIESATRSTGPSATGRILARVPGIHLFTQHPHAADDRWAFAGSVFDGFRVEPADPKPVRRVVVSLGTMETYGFRRLVERLLAVVPSDAEVLWQTGATDVTGLPVSARVAVPSDELEAAITAADVVVAHAGTGTALTCLRLGKQPVLVPRRAAYGEHVDDHQQLTCDYLAGLGLVVAADADRLDLDDLRSAAAHRVGRDGDAPPIVLAR